MKMVTHKGVRFREEDAERLGIKSEEKPKPKKSTARNKARQVEDEATGGVEDDGGGS